MAAFLCFTINCVFMQLTGRQLPSETPVANLVVGWSSMVVVIAGLIAGFLGLAAGIRRRSLDTALIASIGLVLCGGIIFVRLWVLYVISRAA